MMLYTKRKQLQAQTHHYIDTYTLYLEYVDVVYYTETTTDSDPSFYRYTL